MIRKLSLIITLLLIALSVACSGTPATEVESGLDNTTGSIADAPARNSSDSQSETVLVINETGAVSDAGESNVSAGAVAETTRPDGWSDETHSKSADPNYEVVFPEDEVNTMTITIAPDDWQAMLDDMTSTYGEPGSGGGPNGRPGGIGQGDPAGRPEGPGPGIPGGGDFATENPIWVAATIQFEGNTWTDVGVRFKGNSSLMKAWSSGSLELPFKLDFDEFEDENPAIENQRFYGFKQLSLSNNFNDATFMRDVVTSDILAGAGITSAETAFYELTVNYGEGPVNFGLYTMIEVIDDTVIDRVFGDDDGNIYEADGTAVSLAEGTFAGITTSFQKENNQDEADWSDIETLYTVLHSNARQTDPAAWKAEVEAIFDVDTFLHWLAINTVIENWDTYGSASHNYYLYNNPETGLLTWIPWDHNEALNESRRGNMTLDMDSIGDEWPLISFLLADGDYYDAYVSYIDETINTVFEADEMAAKYLEIASLIEPYATEKVGADAFDQGVQALIDHTYARVEQAEHYLTEQVQ